MAQYTERLWTQTKDTEQLTFIAGVDLPYRELVKESGPNTNIMVVATTVDAIGYVLSPKGVLAGEKVDVQMLYGNPGGGGGGGLVVSVTGLDTDNTDPLNPIVNIAVDGVTITGTGYPGDPLVAVGGGGGSVNSVTGISPNVFVDNADPTNPVVEAGTQSWEFSGILTTPVLSNIQNNYTQAGLVNASTLRVVGDLFDPPFFTGIAGGTSGRFLIVHNVSQDTPIYFLHDSASSVAANRIMSPGFIAAETAWNLPINGMAVLQYDATDSRWRVIGNYVYKIIDDGSGVVTIGGDAQFPIVGFNGVNVDGVTITGNGLPGNPLVSAVPGDTFIGHTYFVDEVYGDDGTAVPNSLDKKYKTIDAVIPLMTSNDLCHIFPGSYTLGTFSITDRKNFYFHPGAIVTTTGFNTFDIASTAKLNIYGHAEFLAKCPLISATAPNDATVGEFYVECKSIVKSGSSETFANTTSLKGSIACDKIDNMQIEFSGWTSTNLKVDNWICIDSGQITGGNMTLFNGSTKIADYGKGRFIFSGRNKPRCFFERLEPTSLKVVIDIAPGGLTQDRYVEIHCDYNTVEGFFLTVSSGIMRFWGNVRHAKTNLLGNELPWLFCDYNSITDDSEAPYFEHVEGDWVSAPNAVGGASSLNNELIGIRCLGTFVFNGRYQNSGENTGIGAFPVVQFTNSSLTAGTTTIIFNCKIKNNVGNVGVFQYTNATNPNHAFKLIYHQTTVETPAEEAFYSNSIDPVPLFIYHSLTMNKNYAAIFFDAMSSNRTIIDRDVTVYVPEYEP